MMDLKSTNSIFCAISRRYKKWPGDYCNKAQESTSRNHHVHNGEWHAKEYSPTPVQHQYIISNRHLIKYEKKLTYNGRKIYNNRPVEPRFFNRQRIQFLVLKNWLLNRHFTHLNNHFIHRFSRK